MAENHRVPHILGLGGSLRRRSRTAEAIRVVLDGAHQVGASTSMIDIGAPRLPLFEADADYGRFEPVQRLLEAVRLSDALVIGSPVYLASMSGAVKNALDFVNLLIHERPPCLQGRVVGLLCVAGADADPEAISPLAGACRGLGALVLPGSVALGASSFGPDDEVRDPRARDLLLALGRTVVESSALRRTPGTPGA
jgi:FMN reductase